MPAPGARPPPRGFRARGFRRLLVRRPPFRPQRRAASRPDLLSRRDRGSLQRGVSGIGAGGSGRGPHRAVGGAFSGGLAAFVAARQAGQGGGDAGAVIDDRRPAARAADPAKRDAVGASLLGDRVARFATGVVGTIRVVPDQGEPCRLPGRQRLDADMALTAGRFERICQSPPEAGRGCMFPARTGSRFAQHALAASRRAGTMKSCLESPERIREFDPVSPIEPIAPAALRIIAARDGRPIPLAAPEAANARASGAKDPIPPDRAFRGPPGRAADQSRR